MVRKILVPPDGGWGWMVVGSHALHHLIAVPIMQGFGLLFKDTFNDLGFTATDISLIINTNAAFSMFCGIINGPLLKHLGYRKISLCGALLTTVGVLSTAYAHTFSQFIITYGFIASLGMGMGLSAYPLALNTYFLKKRSKAAGYTMTICGFGPVIMPQVISLLLAMYGVKGAVIIIGGLAGHTFISSLLLQPVAWHMKEEIIDDDTDEVEKDKLLSIDEDDDEDANNFYNKSMAASMMSLQDELEIESKYGIDTPLAGSVLSLHPVLPQRTVSISSRKNTLADITFTEEEDTELENYVKEGNEKSKRGKENNGTSKTNMPIKIYDTELSKEKKRKKKTSLLKRIGKNVVSIFDLTLMKDPIYVNIMVGMSLAVFAELNFSLLTPFIMQDYGLDIQEIATFMSTLSVADICFRFIAPYVSDFFKKPVRIMYMWALVLLILSRFSLLLTTNYYVLLCCAAFLGIAKGFRTVYWTLVIPNYVPIERLAPAIGLQSALNGIFIWIGGPFLGVVRDATGSYKKCIFVINTVTSLTLLMWTTELIYLKFKSQKKPPDLQNIK